MGVIEEFDLMDEFPGPVGEEVLPEKESDVKGPVVKEGMHEAGVAGGVQEGTQSKTRTETKVGTNPCKPTHV